MRNYNHDLISLIGDTVNENLPRTSITEVQRLQKMGEQAYNRMGSKPSHPWGSL